MTKRRNPGGQKRPYGDADKYTVTTNSGDKRCISPTGKDGSPQCQKLIQHAALMTVQNLQSAIQHSVDIVEIISKLRELIVHRCCQNYHVATIRFERRCIDSVLKRYISELSSQGLLHISIPDTVEMPWPDAVDENSIIPYFTDPAETLLTVLHCNISLKTSTGQDLPTRGHLYAFTVPEDTKLQKIGYTGKTVAQRRSQWTCMPGDQISIQKPFTYPERFEKLVHLELRTLRKQKAYCSDCERGHIELFEISREDVTAVIKQWHRLDQVEALYGEDMKLTTNWRRRLRNTVGDVTAGTLLEMLAREKMTAAQDDEQSSLKTEKAAEKTEKRIGDTAAVPLPRQASPSTASGKSGPRGFSETVVATTVSEADRLDTPSSPGPPLDKLMFTGTQHETSISGAYPSGTALAMRFKARVRTSASREWVSDDKSDLEHGMRKTDTHTPTVDSE